MVTLARLSTGNPRVPVVVGGTPFAMRGLCLTKPRDEPKPCGRISRCETRAGQQRVPQVAELSYVFLKQWGGLHGLTVARRQFWLPVELRGSCVEQVILGISECDLPPETFGLGATKAFVLQDRRCRDRAERSSQRQVVTACRESRYPCG